MLWKSTGLAVMIAKMKCLQAADKEHDMTMVAIEKDEDYQAEFKTCVVEKVVEEIAARNVNIAAAKAKYADKGLPEPSTIPMPFTLPEDKTESTVD